MADLRFPLARHQMVWVEPDAWRAFLAELGEHEGGGLIQAWAENGWPLVVRSRGCGDAAQAIALGIALPASHGKKRIAFRLDGRLAIRVERPPLLARAAPCAPGEWRDAIAELVQLDCSTRCFGSLAWELLTDLPYLTDQSDLDLLWWVASAAEADHLADAIARIDAQAPMRLDGEFVTPAGSGVQWREWRAGEPTLLVKTAAGPELMPRGAVFA